MSYDGPSLQLPRLTPAIKHLMLLNAAVFALNIVLWGRLSEPRGGNGGFWFAFSWANALEGFGLGLLRLVSYQFTHAFRDPMHFLMNMLVLYFMGTIAEPKLGYRGAIKLYLAGGVVGALLYLGVAALGSYQNVPLVGASGACYAFLAYAAMRMPMAMVWGILPLWILAAVLVFVGAYATMIELVDGYPQGVAHSAHVGGALLGFVAFKRSWFVDWADHAEVVRPGYFRGLWLGLQRKRAQARQQKAHEQQLQLDGILDKVKRDGLGALSPAERRFLEQMSRQARKGD